MLDAVEIILANVKPYQDSHHSGLPFLSAYQIASELKKRSYHIEPAVLARQLSQAIKNGVCQRIEGGFISHQGLNNMEFADGCCALATDQCAHSIFRYVKE